jgi:hypothetical protein
MDQTDWSTLALEEKKKALFLKQKELLDTFLSHHAISQAQYDKSLGDLRVKMGIPPEEG